MKDKNVSNLGYVSFFQWLGKLKSNWKIIMLQSFRDFMKGIFSLAVGWQIWLFCLILVNFLIPVFFYETRVAQITIVAFFFGGMLGLVLVKIQGFTRLLGLMHIPWIPLVFYLIGQLNNYSFSQPMGLWIRGLIILNGISLIIDFVDVARYIRGERNVIGYVSKS
jgi:predicted neutral ceramidase superfamily lipid hydrolase